jgi:hypothetical protein
VSRRGGMRKRKRPCDITVEVSKVMEERAFAAEVGRRVGWDGVSDRCGRHGLIRWVLVMVEKYRGLGHRGQG